LGERDEPADATPAEPIVGLIVDLRRNSGGSTSLGDLLLSYITNNM